MNLSEKIEEIKGKPEHVRLRYAWFCVSISMVLIISIWVFSVKSSVTDLNSDNLVPTNGLDEVVSQFNAQNDVQQENLDNVQENIGNEEESVKIEGMKEQPESDGAKTVQDSPEKSESQGMDQSNVAAPNLFLND